MIYMACIPSVRPSDHDHCDAPDSTEEDHAINYILFQLQCRMKASEGDTDLLLATLRTVLRRIAPGKDISNIAGNHYYLTKSIRPIIEKEWEMRVVCPNLKCSRIYT